MIQIREDWDVRFDVDRYLEQAEPSLPRLLARPGVRADLDAAVADALALVRPAAIWAGIPVQEFRHERVVLAGGVKMGGGPLTTVIAGAAELVIGICTVGRDISERVTEYQRSGSRLRAMFLDDLGSWGVDQVRQQLCRVIEAEAAAANWRASASLSPGESEWPVTEQAALFALLDARAIGVVLTESLVMSPIKSLSLVVGVGPGPLGVEGASNCDFCTIRERCSHRRGRMQA
jgi:hypothetical protein